MKFSEMSALHVEDEILIAIETAHILKQCGFRRVEMAHTLRAAEALIDAESFDVAILDVNLGNGERTHDLGKTLRERGTHVIFASGYNKSELSDRYQSYPFLEKPVSAKDVRDILGTVLQDRAN